MKFNIGDKVKWTSQAAGSTKTKRGTVYAVVPPRGLVLLPEGTKRSHVKFDRIFPAAVTRYIVAVPRGGKSQIVDYYCPYPGLLDDDTDVEVPHDSQ